MNQSHYNEKIAWVAILTVLTLFSLGLGATAAFFSLL